MAEMNWAEKLLVNSKLKYLIDEKIIFPSFFNFINNELKGKILEIGCGIGNTTFLISKKYPKASIIATDYDSAQIKSVNKNEKIKSSKIKFQQADATRLSFKNSTFDYIIASMVFHHIKDYEKAIEENYRILNNGGYLYLIDVSKYAFWPIGLLERESLFTKKEFIEQLENNGFKIEKSKGRLLFFIAAKKV